MSPHFLHDGNLVHNYIKDSFCDDNLHLFANFAINVEPESLATVNVAVVVALAFARATSLPSLVPWSLAPSNPQPKQDLQDARLLAPSEDWSAGGTHHCHPDLGDSSDEGGAEDLRMDR